MTENNEKKLRVSFNKKLYKKLLAGEVRGRVVTRNGRNVKIIFTDRNDEDGYNIVTLLENRSTGGEDVETYPWNGRYATMPERFRKKGQKNNDMFVESEYLILYETGIDLFIEIHEEDLENVFDKGELVYIREKKTKVIDDEMEHEVFGEMVVVFDGLEKDTEGNTFIRSACTGRFERSHLSNTLTYTRVSTNFEIHKIKYDLVPTEIVEFVRKADDRETDKFMR